MPLLVTRSAGVLIGVLASCALAAPASGRSPQTTTAVVHGATFSVTFSDDICGPRASITTFSLRTQLLHVRERPDGSFNFHFTETGTYHVDFVDPGLQDPDSQFTGSTHHVVTAGGADVITLTWRDLSTGLRIWEQLHVTRLDGRVVIERPVQRVTGCP